MRMNDIGQLSRVRPTYLKKMVAAMAVTLTLSMSAAMAGTEMASSGQIKPPSVASEKDWALEFGTGVAFSNVRTTQNKSYTILPFDLTAALKLDDVGLDHFVNGWFRGYTEFMFRADCSSIVSGPEHYLAGLYVGPRYNFVQPGWKLVPYIEATVGFIFSDANSAAGGLGEDFNFSFEVGAGARYNISDDWFMRLGVEYKHVSNAGMSEPQFPNNAIDSLGPKLSVGYEF